MAEPEAAQPTDSDEKTPAPKAEATTETGPNDRTARSDDDPVDWVAEARKWERLAKENSEAATRLKELEDAKKTEQEKLAEALEAAKAEGSKANTELLRLDVALDKAPEDMPVAKVRKLAKRLTGTTREELEADAADLFAEFEVDDKPASGRPRERLRPGAVADAEPTPDMREIVGSIPRGV